MSTGCRTRPTRRWPGRGGGDRRPASLDRPGRQRRRDRAGLGAGRRAVRCRDRPDQRPRRPGRLRPRGDRAGPMHAASRAAQPDAVDIERRWRPMAAHVRAMLDFQRAGAVVFDYGNNLRAMAQEAGVADAFDYPGFVPAFIRPLFCEGNGPFRWVALSGDPEDIYRTDRALLELFPENAALHRWLVMARERVPFQGCRRGSAGWATASGRRPGSSSTDWSQLGRSRRPSSSGATTSTPARSPHRTGRRRRCATGPTRSPTGRSSTRWSTRPRAPPG